MSEPEADSDQVRDILRPVFISYATSDRKQALSLCKAVEKRGIPCWISTRDVAPGENYQEAIVRSIRDARAIVLVFSGAANNSDEIKKELSLASRYRIPVLTLRIEEVQPSDAFAYELSTRQWIDAFDSRDKAIDVLVSRIAQLSGTDAAASQVATAAPLRRASLRRLAMVVGAIGMVLLVAVAGWLLMRPAKAVAHPMSVRLAGFRLLSGNLPPAMHDAVDAEISAAFNADGVIGVSTSSAPPPGSAPAYAIGGTIHRIGDVVRVITELRNERSSSVLWSDSVDYTAEQVGKIPHKIAVDAGIVVRCGLSGAATYRKPLPDSVFKDYMQYCQHSWAYGGTKTLLPAQRVVAALPDFSWGWSAVQTGFMQAAFAEADAARAEALRKAGLLAADKALALDPANSEALDRKTYLIDPGDWTTKERLYKASIAAKPLDCGCEHFGYGLMLAQVGRLKEAVEQQRAATDMLALWPDSQLALAEAILATGRVEEAKPYFDAAVELAPDAELAGYFRSAMAAGTEDLKALSDPKLPISPGLRAALLNGHRAAVSRDASAKQRAVQALVALPEREQTQSVALLLAKLGASGPALVVAKRLAAKPFPGPSVLWFPVMRPVLSEPNFPTLLKQLGLIRYWKISGMKPDVCNEAAPPPFCRMI